MEREFSFNCTYPLHLTYSELITLQEFIKRYQSDFSDYCDRVEDCNSIYYISNLLVELENLNN